MLPGKNQTYFSSKCTYRYEFKPGTSNLTRSRGPPVHFSGLPYPICSTPGTFTPYASGHVVFADGLHMQTGMYRTCAPSPVSNVLAAFTSTDGYNYTWIR